MTDRKPLILMVEDDEDTARLNTRMLRRKGFDVLIAANAADARSLARDNTPDLYVLDVELPDGDGFALCEEIRRGGDGDAAADAPVLFLSGRKTTEDRVTGISAGGDYYLTKPYSMAEFIAVTARLLQKAGETRSKLNKAVREATELTRGALTLIIPKGRALVAGRDAELTPKEFAILLTLVRNEGKELSGGAIYESVWGKDMNNDTTVIRNHVSRLKKKLGVTNTDDFAIFSTYGEGYMFTAEQ